MTLDIGRKGWIGIGLQTGFQVPAAITDYVDFTHNSLEGTQNQLVVDQATGLRDKDFNTIAGTRHSQGDVEVYGDSVKAGYFIVGALGTVQTTTLAAGVYQHSINRSNSNTPQYLTITSDRVKDRLLYADVAVDKFTLSVGVDLVKTKASLIGNFPQATTSGTKTTTSGNIFNFANAQFAFGTTISGAQAATPLKPHDFNLNINNNAAAIFAHGQNTPLGINVASFEAGADFQLYFENTTDRDAYYAQTKQAASLKLTGNGIGGGFNESMTFNFYKTSIKTFAVETGLDNFFSEKVALLAESDPATQRIIDCTLVNTKALYI